MNTITMSPATAKAVKEGSVQGQGIFSSFGSLRVVESAIVPENVVVIETTMEFMILNLDTGTSFRVGKDEFKLPDFSVPKVVR